jgi:hypothetical protein
VVEPEPLVVPEFADVDDEPDDEPVEDEESDDALDDEDSDDEDSLVLDADVDVVALPRLSVLKKPEPLNVTPTGVKTFFTGRSSPLSGWAISVRFSSWKPCWTSMVSPVSTNL